MARPVDTALAILNGALGDYLHATKNGLALEMDFVGPRASVLGKKAVVLVHGLMCTEDVWTMGDGTDFGKRLERDLAYAPLYVRFNSGRAVSDSGLDLARLLDRLVVEQPQLEEIVLVGFSMGGLVIRSACHHAGTSGHAGAASGWLTRVKRCIYVGTPHLGSPWERAGRTLAKIARMIPDPYVRLAADLGDLRSRGIKDLGDPCHPFPLLDSIEHFLVAGWIDERIASLFGDALVPLASGTNGACIDARALPPDHVRIVPRIAHLDLAKSETVYEHLRSFVEKGPTQSC